MRMITLGTSADGAYELRFTLHGAMIAKPL
jgi:hypothetical protein